MTVLVPHDAGCKYARPESGGHSDAAKRASDWHNLHRAVGLDTIGRYIAVALSDGSSDGILYDTKRDAVRHQHHNENFYAFMAIQVASVTVCAAESFLYTHRLVYKAGGRMSDPDHYGGGRQIIPRLQKEDHARQDYALSMRGLVKPSNLIIPGRDR